jgi:hypothetical protein
LTDPPDGQRKCAGRVVYSLMKLSLLTIAMLALGLSFPGTAQAGKRGQHGHGHGGQHSHRGQNVHRGQDGQRGHHGQRANHGNHKRGHHKHDSHRGHHGKKHFSYYPYYRPFGPGFYGDPWYYGYPGYYTNYWPVYEQRVVYRVSAAALVREVQAALAEGGYYLGPIDGIFGGGTRRAIRAFQRDKNLPVTGRINSTLLDKLKIG